jgi:uncharacterized membrane protein YeaQ/YmgE (transglycosylase-associated protein family)
MSMLVWVMVGIALWHFAVFVPDHFYGGIVGAFIAAIVGAALCGFLVSGLTIPGQEDTNVLDAFDAVPGTLIALGASYLLGARKDSREGIERLQL